MLVLSRLGAARKKSPIVKCSIVIAGRKTSVCLEDDLWEALKEIAGERETTLKDLISDEGARSSRSWAVANRNETNCASAF
jgi:predicted DNA-binding ribbon-helix-helix protein